MPDHAVSRLRIALILIACALAAPRMVDAGDGDQKTGARPKVDFNREVRPILGGKCFVCHGPDEGNRKAGLRLDKREEAVKAAKSGDVPIVGHDPGASEVVARIDADADDVARMPPPGSNKTLSTQEKETLRRWIAEGAEYQEHWAFRRPSPPTVPIVKNRAWVRNPIDAFVLERLEREGLTPSAEADRSTLIRRLSLDLIGLPPTILEVDAFVNDKAADAYEKVVDRLLASPHYGERWARKWLDKARYADTNGYEKDRDRSIWPYRDWVIAALNADMPFDQFTIEQIAGDMLPNATSSQRTATGFHRNTMINEEGGIDVEEFRFASLVDRAATTGSTWLGLTVGCAQCHTHKFDPITQREYYGLLAFLDNADEPELDLPDAPLLARRASIEQRIKALEDDLPNQFPPRDDSEGWEILHPARASSGSGSPLTTRPDGAVLATGDAPEADVYTVVFEGAIGSIDAIRVEALTDPALPRGGPGRATNGNFVLGEIHASLAPLEAGGPSVALAFGSAVATAAQPNFDPAGAYDGDPKTGWAVDVGSGRINVDRSAVFHLKSAAGVAGPAKLTVTLDHTFGGKHSLGKFRISVRRAAPEPSAAELAAMRARHLEARLAAWERSIQSTDWVAVAPTKVSSRKQATMTVLADRSILVTGDRPNNDTYDLEFALPASDASALRLEVLPDPSLPGGGPGRAPLFSVGDFILTNVELSVGARPVRLRDASEDYAQPGRPASFAIDAEPDTGWSVAGGVGKAHQAVFNFDKTADKGGAGYPVPLKLTLHHDGIHQMTIGRFRVSVASAAGVVKTTGLPAEVEALLLVPRDRRTPAQHDVVKRHYLSIAPDLTAQNAAIAALRAGLPRPDTTMVMAERTAANARTTRLRTRGEFLRPAEAVAPGVPSALHPLPQGVKPDRLALARWLVAPENPLTARVAVNGAWHAFFGRGIVATLDDFGVRGDEPTHPALLDWLAVEYPRRGWSTKALHRLIVTSATYRQSSKTTPALLARDPGNQLLARGPRFRVDAETVRDISLAASGLLNPAIGGPSVYPPQPEGVTSLAYGGGGWPTSTGPNRYRRGLYTYLKRTAPYAAFITFDAPTSETACTRRERSNTPLQALTMLNDVVFVEAARALAARVLAEAPATFDARVNHAFRLCLSRPARSDELALIRAFHDKEADRFRKGESDAATVAGPGAKPEAVERAVWTAISRAILNLDETITKE